MNILDRYLMRTVISFTLMVMAALLTLGTLFLYISEQRDVGTGSYGALDAFLYTMLNIPQTIFELLPIGVLIGSLMGLGNLAANGELVITRAAGVSIWRAARPVVMAGALFALGMYLIGEFIAPRMAQYAAREKAASKLTGISFAGGQGAWIKDGNRILRMQNANPSAGLGGVYVFDLSGADTLAQVQRAERVTIVERGLWRLENVAATRFADDTVVGARLPHTMMHSTINAGFLGLANADPTILTLRGLSAYIEHLRSNRLVTAPYQITFWSRIARIFAVMVVALLALPFVFGPLRSSRAGTRTVIGILLGVIFFLANRTIENGGQLFNLNPMLIGWLPTLIIAACTLVAITRTR